MKSAVNKIFYGIILSSVALSIGKVPLCNDLIGIVLIMIGIKYLTVNEDEKGYFKKSYRACFVLLTVVILGHFFDMGQGNSGVFKSAVLPAIGVAINMYLYYFLIKGFKEKAKDYQDICENYDFWWKILFTIFVIMLFYLAFSININGTQIGTIIVLSVALLVTICKIDFAVKMRDNENYVQAKESENEK